MKPRLSPPLAVAFLIGGATLPLPVVAQDSPEQQLTGGSSRQWVFKRIVRSMGAGDACSSGETYTFESDHALLVRDCKDGRLTTRRFTWRLADAGPGDTALVVDGLGTFVLLFRDVPNGGRFMRLRTRGVVPNQPTMDKEFLLNED